MTAAENGGMGLSISPYRLCQLTNLIHAGREDLFYHWPEWGRTRAAVMAMDLGECQLCKVRHRYRRAALVHHVQHLKARPDLALSVYDPETGERQLVSLCRACHEEQHPERMRGPGGVQAPPLTAERWD